MYLDTIDQDSRDYLHAQADVLNQAFNAALHPFRVTLDNTDDTRIEAVDIRHAWRVATRTYGAAVMHVTCVRGCWHCLTDERAAQLEHHLALIWSDDTQPPF